MPELTPDQIQKLQQLGIEIGQQSPSTTSDITPIKTTNNDSKKVNPIFPLLSISGITLLSFSGIVLLKNKSSSTSTPTNPNNSISPSSEVTPTQVPKSIQHYLLTSQQYFSQAIEKQDVELLNQSILAATQAVKEFPSDYRGFYQRARIYQSILSSKPELFSQVISDHSAAYKLEPNSAEITRSLASAYAQKGDAQNTLAYLNQTIILEPTKAQNFYDLAKIQQQTGLLPQALETYNKLITLISDPTQKSQVENEKTAIQKIISQNPNPKNNTNQTNILPTISPPAVSLDSPTIQASTDSKLIVAAPEDINKVEVSTLTSSNSLSGSSTLPANQKEISINNDNLSANSQVYVTILSGGKNQNLQVISKSDKSFTVGLDSAITENIKFKWWIIN